MEILENKSQKNYQIKYKVEYLLISNYIINSVNTEVKWYARGEKKYDKKNDITQLIINPEIVIPKQIVQPSHVENEDELSFINVLMNDYGKEKMNEVNEDFFIMGHSHVNMATNPSSEDRDELKRMAQGLGLFIYHIGNKNNSHSFIVEDPYTVKKDSILDPTIGLEKAMILDQELLKNTKEYIDKSIKEKLKKPAPKYTHYPMGAGFNTPNHGYGIPGKKNKGADVPKNKKNNSKKSNTFQNYIDKSVKDDEIEFTITKDEEQMFQDAGFFILYYSNGEPYIKGKKQEIFNVFNKNNKQYDESTELSDNEVDEIAIDHNEVELFRKKGYNIYYYNKEPYIYISVNEYLNTVAPNDLSNDYDG